MNRRSVVRLCGSAAVAAAVVLAGLPAWGAGPAGPDRSHMVERRVGDGHALRDAGWGGVQIQVVHLSPDAVPSAARTLLGRYPLDRYTIFLVSLDTHAGDLSGYDMAALSELVAAGKTYAPVRWEGIAESSHHRLGALIFPRVDLPADLVIRAVGGVAARTFRWLP
ncbi:MAG: hypothetical protein QN173_08680 [Armatimonadota bacterium]|nr:hypothetical protein [Armatimonadota bacterium]MDR7402269.1 hypothetical protein [Armatimonadota bacterium]MDR7403486.1 hypothetical protein [Armatimonadota bacterium]MDR7437865.1 hypothetical protein [Armatimonadota bacterium]MDR7473321.1 hypothetical protein [Armatimonadota bacterium]